MFVNLGGIMAVSANNMSNAFLKTYLSEVSSKDGKPVTNTSSAVEQEKLVQKFAFQMVLQQMMDSMGNSMMSDLVSSALTGGTSNGLDSSLNLMSSLNNNVRNSNIFGANLNSTNFSQNSKLNMLGIASSKYESNLNPGAISDNPGDYGGKSYGAWQFSSKTGSLNAFLSSLASTNSQYYTQLTQAKAKDGNSFGANFDAAWTSIAKTNGTEFLKLQQQYIGQAYYSKAADTLKTKYGFDINTRSAAMKESLWSTVVQHGVSGAVDIFSKLNLNGNDKSIISGLYDERKKVDVYFKSSSESVRASVYNRFTREKADMLSMLGQG
jgi:hypothetical protein